MAKVPLNPRVGAYGQQQGYYPSQPQGMSYDDLHEGPIDPRQITKNGGALFSFVNAIARGVAETESNELAVRNYVGGLKDQNALYHSKIPSLEAVGNQMARLMNEGERQRAMAQQRANQQPAIQVNLTDLLNADKAFDNITQGSSRPVIQNNYTKEEPKTMSDIDISEYLGGTPQRSAVQQNNTFYVNMDKTSKAILAEQFDVEEDKITEETDLQEDLGADSLDVVDLLMSIEDEFEVEVPDEEIENLKTVGALVSYIEANS